MRLKETALNLLCCLFFAAFPFDAKAMDLTLSTSDQIAPYVDKNAPEGGPFTVLVRGAFQEVGWDIKVSFLPTQRAYQEALDLETDGTYPRFFTQKRYSEMYYSAPLVSTDYTVFVNRKNLPDAASLEDLNQRMTCLALGSPIPEPLNTMVKQENLQVMWAESYRQCFAMLAMGRADFVATDRRLGMELLEELENGLRDIATFDLPTAGDSVHLIVSRKHPQGREIIKAFNRGLKLFKDAGKMPNTFKVPGKKSQSPPQEPANGRT